jgi:hypothetical protein
MTKHPPQSPTERAVALVRHYAPMTRHWTAAERYRLRQIVVQSMLDVMRDCPDRQVRADAHAVLMKMGVQL